MTRNQLFPYNDYATKLNCMIDLVLLVSLLKLQKDTKLKNVAEFRIENRPPYHYKNYLYFDQHFTPNVHLRISNLLNPTKVRDHYY
jgi:hypothetical protein